MKKNTLVPLDRSGRLIRKAMSYLSDMEAFLDDAPGSVTILIDALPHAEASLKLKILPLLGTAGKDQALWPLFRLLTESTGNEVVCRSAAVQLGLAASLSEDPGPLSAALIENLDHPEVLVRSACALALGWEGNHQAIPALMDHLQDPDRDVQAAVIAALSSVGDPHVFDFFTERLKNGSMEERRSILLNLWRFGERNSRIEQIYLNSLDHLSPELHPDILSALTMIPNTPKVISIYRRMLSEKAPAIRRQVLENLEGLDPQEYEPLQEILHELLDDADPRVRQLVIRLLREKHPTLR
ncbi:HEAT repeat domain-containing protein [uncultured Desulfosarcina sp.]|uniref:HEAT repeat domain-containing protein n=1 Tax=uncultured Desulfosarcina sp. TaxID=218289 RepID=UPI0029C9A8EA|nr:HEAT repeat domain-containing protein [uncultured Desulfosarcina sp.]